MVNYNDPLENIFRALADPTRREILERLSRSGTKLTAGELAWPFEMSLPAISKHLKYLESAGLIARSKHGRNFFFVACSQPVEEANWWLAEYLHFLKPAMPNPTQAKNNPKI